MSIPLRVSSPRISRLCDFEEPEFPDPDPTILHNLERYPVLEKSEAKWIELFNCPLLLSGQMDRAKLHLTSEHMFRHILERGIPRLNACPARRRWESVRHYLRDVHRYQNDDHWSYITETTDRFEFKIDHHGTIPKKRNLRVPEDLFSQVSAIASNLGISVSTLSQVLIADALRTSAAVQFSDKMTDLVNRFHEKILTRTRIVIAVFGALRENVSHNAFPEWEMLVEEVNNA